MPIEDDTEYIRVLGNKEYSQLKKVLDRRCEEINWESLGVNDHCLALTEVLLTAGKEVFGVRRRGGRRKVPRIRRVYVTSGRREGEGSA